MSMNVSQEPKMTWIGAKELVDPRRSITRGSLYVAENRIRNMLKWWKSIVAFGLGNPTLYLLSIGIGIGALVDNSQLGQAAFGGVSYLTFLAPALLATAGIQGAMDEVTWPTLEGFVWDKTYFAMNATAITGRQIANGAMMAAMVRCVIQVFLYELCLLAFGAITWQSIPMLLVVSSLAGLGFAAIMMAFSATIKQDDGIFALVNRFIITPMFMFSGTFYPIDSLPIYLRWIGWVSPQWHATNLGRSTSYGMSIPSWLLILHWVVLIGMAVIGLSISHRIFAKRLAA